MPTLIAVPPDLIDAIEGVFEDAACALCEDIAVAVGTMQPCGHTFHVCRDHRRMVSSHVAWRVYNGTPLACGESGEPVLALTWERRA